MKIFEYYGQGLPVFSTKLPSLIEQNIPLLTFMENVEDFNSSLKIIGLKEGADKQSEANVRANYAAAHSWEARIRQAKELLKEITS